MLINVHNTENIFPVIDQLKSSGQKINWQNKRTEYYKLTGNPNELIANYILYV